MSKQPAPTREEIECKETEIKRLKALAHEKPPLKRHLKLIGASQHGKSSMAAALLDTITRTYNPEFVQIALLDLEDKTGKLFHGTDAPCSTCQCTHVFEKASSSTPPPTGALAVGEENEHDPF